MGDIQNVEKGDQKKDPKTSKPHECVWEDDEVEVDWDGNCVRIRYCLVCWATSNTK